MGYELKTVEIDTENGTYKVNGKDISKSCTRFSLNYEDGDWSLETEETKSFEYEGRNKEVEAQIGAVETKELESLSMPIVDYIKKMNPYTMVHISDEEILITENICFVPIKSS